MTIIDWKRNQFEKAKNKINFTSPKLGYATYEEIDHAF